MRWFATSVAAVDGLIVSPDPDVMRHVVGVRVANAVRACPLHHPCVVPPVHGPAAHVVVGRVVDAALVSFALLGVVSYECLFHGVVWWRSEGPSRRAQVSPKLNSA